MTLPRLHNILVTGGTGFIGSSLIPVLLNKGYHVTAVDHNSAGKKQTIDTFLSYSNFDFIELDLLNGNKLKEVVKKHDLIFHLAGNSIVQTGYRNSEVDFINNVLATRNVLENMRTSDSCKKIIFISTSAIYGEALKIPTPEDYGPLKPTSMYGASKLACEALISGYAGTFGIEAVIFRLANVVGPSNTHGVIFDFIRKLAQSDGKYLEILGDGTQKKSYIYIDDCIDTLANIGFRQFESGLEIFNVGSDDQIDTNSIARIIITELGLQTEIRYASQQNDGRGWIGDIKNMLLSTDKLKKIGWRINHSSKDSVSLTTKEMIAGKHIKIT
ncbi:MAG TPA: NAD-dependent epimerase/dehydratase family protein [Nitrososphaeraceae archaeon]|jgi:UDP-glucose 4-epimerase